MHTKNPEMGKLLFSVKLNIGILQSENLIGAIISNSDYKNYKLTYYTSDSQSYHNYS